MRKFPILLIAAFALSAASGGCAAQPGTHSVNAAKVSQQLIVKFRGAECDAQAIARLALAASAQLVFQRPVSGGACVATQSAPNAEALRGAQQRMKTDPAVEWVEPDSMMTTH